MKTVYTVKDDQSSPLPAIHLGVCQNMAITPIPDESVPFGVTTGLIRIVSTVDCYVDIGINPPASSNSSLLPAGISEYFGTSPGERVSFLSFSGSGVISITECR